MRKQAILDFYTFRLFHDDYEILATHIVPFLDQETCQDTTTNSPYPKEKEMARQAIL